jgi:predicted Zn-dependent protease
MRASTCYALLIPRNELALSRLEKLQEFLVADPTDSFTRYAIGLEYAKAGKYDDAIRALEELRERDPGYIPTYYMLAGYYRETKDKVKAETIFREGIMKACAANDLHAASELQAALDELEDEL